MKFPTENNSNRHKMNSWRLMYNKFTYNTDNDDNTYYKDRRIMRRVT